MLLEIQLENPKPRQWDLVLTTKNQNGSITHQPLGSNRYFYIKESSPIGFHVLGSSVLNCLDFLSNLLVDCQLELLEMTEPSNSIHVSQTFVLRALRLGNFSSYAIQTIVLLDRERKEKYALHLGTTQNDLIRIITVCLLDVNDNKPQLQPPFVHVGDVRGYATDHHLPISLLSHFDQFSFYGTNVFLSYHEQPGFTVLMIRALDADVGPNGKLTYSIQRHLRTTKDTSLEERHLADLFQLNAESGLLTLNRKMNEADLTRHFIIIAVTDQGEPQPLGATGLIDLHVLEIPPYQRPINDPPEINHRTNNLPHLLSSNALLKNEAKGRTASPENVIKLSSERYSMGQNLLIGMLILLIIVCPTLIFWLFYLKRGLIRNAITTAWKGHHKADVKINSINDGLELNAVSSINVEINQPSAAELQSVCVEPFGKYAYDLNGYPVTIQRRSTTSVVEVTSDQPYRPFTYRPASLEGLKTRTTGRTNTPIQTQMNMQFLDCPIAPCSPHMPMDESSVLVCVPSSPARERINWSDHLSSPDAKWTRVSHGDSVAYRPQFRTDNSGLIICVSS
ncbi:hypothetical protein EG68_09139 [Paragonimus skrjabini miyazakii]|uniref:Cadherin domain-containing protein n=1 Tax=Paragonimus skrjabini miyazakii TaxID=59628 RepID=A0A8S9YUP0_9TREM|nr:hypothetical protein EG68_09139 [Paragonimus skrjabini miyazakii]